MTFREPWEAHAFAMTLALHARGLHLPEWTEALAAQIAAAQARGDADLGDTYYRHWPARSKPWSRPKGRRPPTNSPAPATPGTVPPTAPRTGND